MTQITIRGLEPGVEKHIRTMARKSGKSLSRVVLDIIYQHIGLKKEKGMRPGDSLKKLAGGWNEEDSAEFMESIKSCEQIEEEMWK